MITWRSCDCDGRQNQICEFINLIFLSMDEGWTRWIFEQISEDIFQLPIAKLCKNSQKKPLLFPTSEIRSKRLYRNQEQSSSPTNRRIKS